jgi:hypothetical protein
MVGGPAACSPRRRRLPISRRISEKLENFTEFQGRFEALRFLSKLETDKYLCGSIGAGITEKPNDLLSDALERMPFTIVK